jgi:hypothetical protein
MIAGECTWSSEHAWNAVGRRRVYVETGPNEYEELPYVQPALEFDPQTGLPAEGAGEVAEHIMVQFLEGEQSKERVAGAVDSIYRWCNILPENFFATSEAFAAHKEYVSHLQKNFNEVMSSKGQLRLLSASEREDLRQKGATIHEYTAANHGEEGAENA